MTPGLCGDAREIFEMRPGSFRIHVVGRHRGDAAPIVHTGAQELRQRLGLKVRRRLDGHAGSEDQPGGGDGPELLLECGLGRAGHFGAGLALEILDDEFLQMPVLVMNLPQREQRIDALPAGFADADQQPRGHRDPKFAGGAQRRESHGRRLVG